MVIGIDVGTTSVKIVLVDSQARIIAQAACEYPTRQPEVGWSEQNALDWWQSIVTAMQQLGNEQDLSGVRALALSTQGDTMVPVDAQGTSLAPARTWMDTRTADLIPALEEKLSIQQWHQITGGTLGPYAAALTIEWYRQKHPEIFSQTARFALVGDLCAQWLCGTPLLDYPNASRTLLFDLDTLNWSDILLQHVGVIQDQLAKVAPSGTVAGTLTARAANELGLPVGIAVCVGGHDQTCAAIGCGVIDPGDIMLSCGTAWVLLAAQEHPVRVQDSPGIHTYCHAAPDKYAMLAAYAGGNILSWFREQICLDTQISFDRLSQEAQQAFCDRHAEVLLLPQFYGSSDLPWTHKTRGVFIGLSLSNTRGDLALSVLRGVALETARNLQAFSMAGAAVGQVKMIGGGANSDFWAQLVANTCQVDVVRPQVREAAAYGAALLAGVAVGSFNLLQEITEQFSQGLVISPDVKEAEKSAELLDLYCCALQNLAELKY